MARDPKFDVLFEPIQIGPKTLRNRFWQVPQCNTAGTIRPGTQAIHRQMKAEGGWAVVCTEGCSIAPCTENDPSILCSLWDNDDVINLRHMCDKIHKHGGLAGVELLHAGTSHGGLGTREVAMAPTQASGFFSIGVTPHEMDIDDIKWTQQLYVDATKRALDAGFDIVYVYASHGLLPAAFLSKFYNHRTDAYGGSLDNRMRFLVETLEKMKSTMDGQAAMALRFAVDQFVGPDGLQAWDDSVKIAEKMTQYGLVDVWDLNVGTYSEWGEDAGPSRSYKTNHEAPFTRYVKDVVNVPVINVGRFTSPDDMVDLIESGQADIIGGARPTISDPFLPKKIEEGRLEDIRECIGCNQCISRWERGVPMVCTQNPTANEEYRRGWHPEKFEKPSDPGDVLVVGGGPAGMECARVLGERGFDVHLIEAEKALGGHLKDVIRFPGLNEWGRLITYREAQLAKLKNVEVHTGAGMMSAEKVLTYGADKVVLCTGFHWDKNGFNHVTMSNIPGADANLPQFCTPEQVMAGKELGDRVLVIDADSYYTAISVAEFIADQGKQVAIVAPMPSVAFLTEFTLEAANLHRMMHAKKIKAYTSSWVESCEVNGGVVNARLFSLFRDSPERTTKPGPGVDPRVLGTDVDEQIFDTVVLVTARLSNNSVYKELRERKEEWAKEEIEGIYQAGDGYAPRLISETVFDGHRIAREIELPDAQRYQRFLRERMVWGKS
jgi:dimethylamine/trimethylamine dehydrogenase